MKRIFLLVALIMLFFAATNAEPYIEIKDTMDYGQKTFTALKCGNCHSVTSQNIVGKMKGSKELSSIDTTNLKNYINKETSRNNVKHMYPFKGTTQELDIIVNWLKSIQKPTEKK